MGADIAGQLPPIPMSPMLGQTLARAAQYATEQAHAEVTLEHLLLALAEDEDASQVLQSSGVNIEALHTDISQHVGRIEHRLHPGEGATATISEELRRILNAAAVAARAGRRPSIDGAIVLAAIIGDARTSAAGLLRAHGLTFEVAINAIRQAARPAAPPEPPAGPPPQSLPPPPDYHPPPGGRSGGPENMPPDANEADDPRAGGSAMDILATARARVASRRAPGYADSYRARDAERAAEPESPADIAPEGAEVVAESEAPAPIEAGGIQAGGRDTLAAGAADYDPVADAGERPPATRSQTETVDWADETAAGEFEQPDEAAGYEVAEPEVAADLAAVAPGLPDNAAQGVDEEVQSAPGTESWGEAAVEETAALEDAQAAEDDAVAHSPPEPVTAAVPEPRQPFPEPPAPPPPPQPAPEPARTSQPQSGPLAHAPPERTAPPETPRPPPAGAGGPPPQYPGSVSGGWAPPPSEPRPPAPARRPPGAPPPLPPAVPSRPMPPPPPGAGPHGPDRSPGGPGQPPGPTQGRQEPAWAAPGARGDFGHRGMAGPAQSRLPSPDEVFGTTEARPAGRGPGQRPYPGPGEAGVAAERSQPPGQHHRPPSPPPAAPQSGAAPGGTTGTGRRTPILPGQLVETIPRRMRVGIPSPVEVRIAKAEVKAISEGLDMGQTAFRHDIQVTKAMSVRLRAPHGGFFIETSSPETQWIENALGLMADDFARWRWTVTPKERGKKRLQLIVSARSVGPDGLAAETALPEQVIEVQVATNYAVVARNVGGWALAAVAGGLLAQFGADIWGLLAPVVTPAIEALSQR